MRFGSLFAGIGGFDRGLENAGHECAWQVEVDERCTEALAQHWPHVPRFGDVRECGAANLASVDLVCGGFPCQDVSVAGRRAGLAGERSGLWFEFHRVLAELRPRWCLIENVPGLLSSNGGRDFAILVRGLAELGYGAAWRILDAQYFGVAQRRRRVFIVGSLGDYGCAEVLFESEGLCGNPTARREAGQAVAGTLGGSSQEGGFRTADLDNQGAFIADTLGTSADRVTGKQGALAPVVFESRFARNDRGGPDVIVPPLKAQSGQSGKGDGAPLVVAHETGKGFWTEGLPGLRGQPGGMPENLVAFVPEAAAPLRSRQLTSGGGKPGQGYPAALVGGGVRRLTPTECERLQGFPDSWTAGFADSVRYRMLGNAVCVPVAEWIGRRIATMPDAMSAEEPHTSSEGQKALPGT